MKKTVSIILSAIMILSIAVCFVGCGGGDSLSGTWVQQTENYGEMTLTFDGNGSCSFSHDLANSKGTYKISEDGKQVVVTYELWSEPVTFDFTVDESTLNLQDVKDICAIKGAFTKK